MKDQTFDLFIISDTAIIEETYKHLGDLYNNHIDVTGDAFPPFYEGVVNREINIVMKYKGEGVSSFLESLHLDDISAVVAVNVTSRFGNVSYQASSETKPEDAIEIFQRVIREIIDNLEEAMHSEF